MNKERIVSGVLLIVLLAGGVYFVRQGIQLKAENRILTAKLAEVQTQPDSQKQQLPSPEIQNGQAQGNANTSEPALNIESSLGIKSKNNQEYKTVKLDNGELYFGIITEEKNGFITLVDIFYFQNYDASRGVDQQPQVSLVKFGNELRGPEDKMLIDKNNITSIETLRPDGQVAMAISSYKSSQPQ